jgi:hypothetical protein
MLKKIITLIIIANFNIGFSQNTSDFFEKSDSFFKEYVLDGKVNYDAIKNNPSKLTEILNIAKTIVIDKSHAANFQAFWINAYNLSVIKGIVDNYPIKSPLDKAGFFDKVTYELGGKKYTLNDIEHKLLRAQFRDARFHFVLVCGAIGCPPLINRAYLASTLDSQLQAQTKIALNGTFLRVNAKKKKVEASEIMKWYKEDFTMKGIREIDFINVYRTEKIPSHFKLSYFPYNWGVNKQ